MARSELSGAQGKFGGSRVRGEGESDRLGACVDVRFRCEGVFASQKPIHNIAKPFCAARNPMLAPHKPRNSVQNFNTKS